MPISDRLRKSLTGASWIRKMFEEGVALKQRHGAENVFDLSLGNPIMEPPAEFHRELLRLAGHPLPGMHRYMENAGYVETRAAVAEQLSGETGLKLSAGDVVMTCGAAGALNVVLKTLLDPGDEVIIFAPYFVEFLSYVDNHGGRARVVPTDDEFLPRLDALEAAIGAGTKAVIVNSPNNPTGAVYGEGFMRGLAELLRKKETEYGSEIFLISDETYRRIVFDGLKCAPALPCHPRSIVVSSHSKDLAVPGERIGYIAVNPGYGQRQELVDGLIYCNRVLGYVNAPALMQRVVRHLQQVTVPVSEYERKRDFLYGELVALGYSVVKPQGAFYMFPKSLVEDDVAFVRELLQWNVLTVPGRGFGSPGHFRIAYCVDDRTLEGSLAGFRNAAEKFGLSQR